MNQEQIINLFIKGTWVRGEGSCLPVVDKYTGRPLGVLHEASGNQVDAAIDAARGAFVATRLEPHERCRIMDRVADAVTAATAELTALIVAESGVPWKDSANEVARCAETFRLSAEEGRRLVGEMVPIQGASGQAHRMAFTLRVPRGVVGGISAFNSPLNMAAHKIAPALASGNVVVFKPPASTPMSATRLFELMLEAGVPPGHITLLQGDAEVGRTLVAHPGIDFLTFTGSTPVGRSIRQVRGLRPVALELGSIAATIVCDDANLDRAVTRCTQSAFRRQGQACTSTQRLFVQRGIIDAFTPRLVAAARALVVGDPHDPQTDVGPMISVQEAERALAWVLEAIDEGAHCLSGGTLDGALLAPTILTNVSPDMRVMREEIFAPVLSIIPFDDLDVAIAEVNATEFGLAVGLFTADMTRALNAASQLHVGVVHLNDASSSRVDLMPFAGVKDSGVGVEGPRYAMREMTEERLVTISL
ncbi:MAG: aldehyde dehydrogenase [Alphaproteobacteria bacterium]|nr:MAG: aldehyde dehydrogenase [Alphaproteobacteria bacterium]